MPKKITGAEPFGKAFKVLLGLASNDSVTIYGRGVNDHEEPLYELSGKNIHLTNLTACQVVGGLIKTSHGHESITITLTEEAANELSGSDFDGASARATQ